MTLAGRRVNILSIFLAICRFEDLSLSALWRP